MGEESADDIPAAIAALAASDSAQEAERHCWKIDHHAVFNEIIAEPAQPTVRCVLAALHLCTDVARPWLLDVLVEIGAGQPSDAEMKHGDAGLAGACRRELCYGSALFFHLLENGTYRERCACIDLLGLCAAFDPHLKERAIWWFEKLAAESEANGDARVDDCGTLLRNWLPELKRP